MEQLEKMDDVNEAKNTSMTIKSFFCEQALQDLQELSLPSYVLKQLFQACVENFPEGCSLDDFFGIIQQLID